MSKINSTFGLFSYTGLALSGAVALVVATAAIEPATAAEIKVKFDGREFQLKRNSIRAQNPVIGTTKGDRDESDGGKKVFPKVAIGKGDRDEDKPKTQQIVIGKGDQAEENEAPRKRQVIVEPKPKKILVSEDAPKLKKKVVVAAVEEPKVEQVADAAPAEDAPAVTEEAPVTEAPVDATEQQAETPAAPEPQFKIGQIVTGGDGKNYVIVKIDEFGVSALPLSAFADYEQPHKVYKKKHKKRYASYGYSYSRKRSYGGSSCH